MQRGWKISIILLVLFLTPVFSFSQEVQNKFPVAYSPSGGILKKGQQLSNNSSSLHPYAEEHIIVKFKKDASSTAIASANAKIQPIKTKRFNIVKNLHLVKLPPEISVQKALEYYRRDPNVLYAEPDYIVHALGVPNDPYFGSLWGLHNTGQNGGTPGADIQAVDAWNITTGSKNVVVAVIDTGVDYNHPDLAASMWRNTDDCNNNEVDDDGNGYIDDCHGIDTLNGVTDPMDDNNHGTHVAGIIGAAGNNNIGVVGVNWNVSIMACKFLGSDGSGYISGAIECLEYVNTMEKRGINIVATNNSWGTPSYSQSLFDTIDVHRQAGILFIAAAGNGSASNDRFPSFYPASYNLPNIISVAATDRLDNKADFSNNGKRTVHLGAPGDGILSTAIGNTYVELSGTSMAAPHVTGVAALLKAQDGSRDWRAIKNLLLAGGETISPLTNTITQKRLNAYGSMACSDSFILSRLLPLEDTLYPATGSALNLSALHIKCAAPNGEVTVTVNPEGEPVALTDDGLGIDQVAGDGIYSGQWTPSTNGIFTLTFPNGEAVTVVVGQLPPDSTYSWHTFYGGSGYDYGTNLTIDGSGNIYITGDSSATWNGPAGELPLHAHSGGHDMSVVKLDSSGAYQWHTFYGSSSWDLGYGIATDGDGNVYVTAESDTTWNGAAGEPPLHAHTGNMDITVLKLDSSGAYQWHTFYGSGDRDDPRGIITDESGNVYLTGFSNAPWNGPAGQPPLRAYNGVHEDFFVLKLNSGGSYQWHTFSGAASSFKNAFGIAPDGVGNFYITGNSGGTWNGPAGQPPLHAYSGGICDMFVLKLNSSGSYQWHTFYGSSEEDQALDMTTDGNGNIYVVGFSSTTWNGPTGQPPLHSHSGGSSYGDICVLKLDNSGSYQWHTFYGSSADELGYGIAVDRNGNVYVTGDSVAAWNGPVGQPPLHRYTGPGNDMFVLKLNTSGSYQWHTFYGTSYGDYGMGIAAEGNGAVYVVGDSGATWNGPAGQLPLHAYTGNAGPPDIYVLKFVEPFVCTELFVTSQPKSQTILNGQTATLAVGALGTMPFSYQWYQGLSGNTSDPISGATSGSYTTLVLTQTNTYWVRVTNYCGYADSNTATITVISCTVPSITSNPQSQTIPSGQTATISVDASGTTPFTYQWYRGSSGVTSNPIIGANSTSYTTPALTQTTSYWVRVANSCGSTDSNTATITVIPAGPPSSPTNVSASDGTYLDRVEVTWASSLGATSYSVYRATSLARWVRKIFLGSTSGNSFNDTTAIPKRRYFYWVKASNTYGTSNFSTYDTGYRSDGSPPIPMNLAATDGTYPDRVELTWAPSPNAASYTVYRATSLSRLARKIVLGTTPGISLNDTTAIPGRIYYYWVRASNTYGTSNFSSYDSGYR